MAIVQEEGKVVIFGGEKVVIFGGEKVKGNEYLGEFMTVDLENNSWTIKKKGLLRGDMFYYNQKSTSLLGRSNVAILGKEHVHFIEMKNFVSTGIHKDDGDFPEY